MSASRLIDELTEDAPRSGENIDKTVCSSSCVSASLSPSTSHREKERRRRQVMRSWMCRLEKLLPNDVSDYPSMPLKKQKTNKNQKERVRQLDKKYIALESINIHQIGQELRLARDENRQLKQLLAANRKQYAFDDETA
uniref:BHLH domain-containing protein n=1 Tax=Plectus sambesii TaxID=2011161 RepID=A0A914X5L1_9BILA